MIYKFKDSIDIYVIRNEILYFYYINTRKSYEFKVSSQVLDLIKLIDGKRNVEEISNTYNESYSQNIRQDTVLNVLKYLESLNLLVKVELTNSDILNDMELERYNRQINFLSEFNIGEDAGILAQENIKKTKVAIFGCGAIGGDIALMLAMAGIESFVLIDFKKIKKSDATRHMFFRNNYIELFKTEALSREMKNINNNIKCTLINSHVLPQTDIEDIVRNVDFIVNTMDEPYIGYTSLKISRMCMKYNKPHYIGGGFDIHLMSSGELIIPFKTPCVECYTTHFKKVLSDWKPENKKKIDQINEYGGLASQALFSAAIGTLQILKYLSDFSFKELESITRGELNFNNYEFTYLNIEKNPTCKTCGGQQ